MPGIEKVLNMCKYAFECIKICLNMLGTEPKITLQAA